MRTDEEISLMSERLPPAKGTKLARRPPTAPIPAIADPSDRSRSSSFTSDAPSPSSGNEAVLRFDPSNDTALKTQNPKTKWAQSRPPRSPTDSVANSPKFCSKSPRKGRFSPPNSKSPPHKGSWEQPLPPPSPISTKSDHSFFENSPTAAGQDIKSNMDFSPSKCKGNSRHQSSTSQARSLSHSPPTKHRPFSRLIKTLERQSSSQEEVAPQSQAGGHASLSVVCSPRQFSPMGRKREGVFADPRGSIWSSSSEDGSVSSSPVGKGPPLLISMDSIRLDLASREELALLQRSRSPSASDSPPLPVSPCGHPKNLQHHLSLKEAAHALLADVVDSGSEAGSPLEVERSPRSKTLLTRNSSSISEELFRSSVHSYQSYSSDKGSPEKGQVKKQISASPPNQQNQFNFKFRPRKARHRAAQRLGKKSSREERDGVAKPPSSNARPEGKTDGPSLRAGIGPPPGFEGLCDVSPRPQQDSPASAEDFLGEISPRPQSTSPVMEFPSPRPFEEPPERNKPNPQKFDFDHVAFGFGKSESMEEDSPNNEKQQKPIIDLANGQLPKMKKRGRRIWATSFKQKEPKTTRQDSENSMNRSRDSSMSLYSQHGLVVWDGNEESINSFVHICEVCSKLSPSGAAALDSKSRGNKCDRCDALPSTEEGAVTNKPDHFWNFASRSTSQSQDTDVDLEQTKQLEQLKLTSDNEQKMSKTDKGRTTFLDQGSPSLEVSLEDRSLSFVQTVKKDIYNFLWNSTD